MGPILFPWASYDPDDIPDLNPHNEEETAGCIAAVIAFLISTVLFVLIECGVLALKRIGFIGFYTHMILQIVDVGIYVVLTIFLMKLSFKIADKIILKKNNHHA